MRKHTLSCLVTLLVFVSLTGEALAHRVNIFAFVDGDEIQVECGFSTRQKVRNGKIVVTDFVTGETIHEGVTDAQGIFRFRPTDEFLQTGHGLNIRVYAGEGHQNDWKMPPEVLEALSPSKSSDAPTLSEEQAVEIGEAMPAAGIDAVELEAIVDKVVSAKLAPINRALAEQQEAGPGLRDIIGGIGWILGLLGIATYMKYRRFTRANHK